MQPYTAWNMLLLTSFLNYFERYGVMWHSRRSLIRQNAKPEHRRDIFQRHDALKFYDTWIHKSAHSGVS
jgi:hypothetical protein